MEANRCGPGRVIAQDIKQPSTLALAGPTLAVLGL